MTNNSLRPSDHEIATIVHKAGNELHKITASPRKRLRISVAGTAALAALGIAGVAGAAYATVQAVGGEPTVHQGNSTLGIGTPSSGDKWLNVGFAFRCSTGETFTLRDGKAEIMSGSCDDYSPGDGSQDADLRGIYKSVPADSISSSTLRLTTDFDQDYRIEASYGPSAQMRQLVLPGRNAAGLVQWTPADYKVNEYGLTVGTPNANTPENQYPDLVPRSFEGREAYELGRDVNRALPTNPEEAVKYMNRLRDQGITDEKGNIYRRLYAADGKTLIGKVNVGTYSQE